MLCKYKYYITLKRNLSLSLRPIDVEFMLNIHEKVNVIPIISKADMLTEKEKIQIKQRINDSIKSHEIKVNLLLISLKTIVRQQYLPSIKCTYISYVLVFIII